MPSSASTSSLTTLVNALVPSARTDSRLRGDLLEDCQEILESHIGQNREADIGHLGGLIKKQLLQSSNSTTALRFSNLLSRLLEEPLLSRKHAVLLFLHSIAFSEPSSGIPVFLPSITSAQPHAAPQSNVEPRRPLTPITNGNQRPEHQSQSKADMLRAYRLKIGRPQLPENLVLRDALYILQGISGKYVHFVAEGDTAASHNGANTSTSSLSTTDRRVVFVEDGKLTIGVPTRSLIHKLSELGHLYARVVAFVQSKEGKSSVGMIEQSLCHHLQTQLTEYYRLIAVLESQMYMSSDDEDVKEESGLTLRRLEVWIDEWRLRMRMMSVCVEGCKDSHGGALVSLIHTYTDNGDPFVRRFTDALLEEVSTPFFMTLQRWLFSGELHDPFLEFFVALNPGLADVQYVARGLGMGTVLGFGEGDIEDGDASGRKEESGLRLWEEKYRFRKEMLPSFVGETFGRKIFSTGKSLNFIRYSCHDSDWVVTQNRLGNTGRKLVYSDIGGLERSIDSAYQIASQRLFDVFFDKFKLLDHLRALKSYLMLRQGDFADQLLETIGPSLNRPANTLYRHNLTATLESAVRNSNAQYDPPDVLRRLDARMLEYSHGEIGWDVFTLEYKVDAPIDTVLDPVSMEKYLRLFNHLWKMRRVDAALGHGWVRITKGTRMFARVPELEASWHQVRIVMAEMIHFMRQLQAYCHLEVIECSWKSLLEFIEKKEGDLDGLIEAHNSYLDRMVKKVLLLSPKTGKEENILTQVREVFNIILQFREATDNLYNHSLAEAGRRDNLRDKDRGIFETPLDEDAARNANPSESLPRILRRIKDYSLAFSDRALAIVVALNSHPDLDCKFLGVRLSFSDFYRAKKEQLQLQHAQNQK
ncbi:hypothetical protein BOTBODRAFT_64327 [Botryobasidium botryosum FD-172 SS1]|uniref:Uncharacterized protein n=1 Tax=Botryobasidium botryosum (strain FD-172 SS1) TaxID=930990 RepID=A0A067MZP7_BOTB1|nr:hypothetical protein BOTBODRAFT_64327 [Botryobasidium botryosum FD-172 SS1]